MLKWFQPASDIIPAAHVALSVATFLASVPTTTVSVPVPLPSGKIISIDHEEGDLSDYDSTVGSEDLNVESSANQGLTNFGMRVTCDDTSDHYGVKEVIGLTRFLRYRFYFDPTSLTMGVGDSFVVINFLDAAGAARSFCRVDRAASTFQMLASVSVDPFGIPSDTALYDLLDGPNLIEVRIARATTDSASDGFLEFYINGTLVEAKSGLDIFDLSRPATVRIGISGQDTGTTGSFAIDEIVVRDDDALIGPVAEISKFYMQHPGPPAFMEAPRPVNEGGMFFDPGVIPFGLMFVIDHEEGDFTDYDSVVDPGGDLSIVQAGLAVTDNAMRVTLNDTSDHYGRRAIDWRTRDIRVGVHLQLGDIDFGSPTDVFQVWSLRTAAGALRAALYMANDPTGRVFWASVVSDSGVEQVLPLQQTSDNPHIEVRIKRSKTAVPALDGGELEMFIDGTSVASRSGVEGIDLFDLSRPEEIRVGPQDSAGSFTGSFDIDEIVLRDDETQIKPSNTMAWFAPPSQPLTSRGPLLEHLYATTLQQEIQAGAGAPFETWYFLDVEGLSSCGLGPVRALDETPGTSARLERIDDVIHTWNRIETNRSLGAGIWTVQVNLATRAILTFNVTVRIRHLNSSCALIQTIMDITQEVVGPLAVLQEFSFVQAGVPQIDFLAGDVLTVDVIALPQSPADIFIIAFGSAVAALDSRLENPLEAPPGVPVDFGWIPSYPVVMPPKTPLVAEGYWTGVLEEDLFEELVYAGRAYYPDTVPGRTPLVQEGFWAGVLEETLVRRRAPDWLPSYPDFVYGKPPLVPEGFWAGVLDPTRFIEQNLTWIPVTNQPPDNPAPLVAEGFWTGVLEPTVFGRVIVDWMPETNQPILVAAPLIHQDWFRGVERPVVPENVSWIPVTNQPPDGHPPAPPQDYWTGVLEGVLFPSDGMPWLPETKQPPRGPAPLIQSDWFRGIERPIVDENISWIPVTNQPPAGLAPLVAEGYWAGVLEPTVFGRVIADWMPETNRPPRGFVPLTYQDYWAGVLDPTRFVRPDLFLPVYPDIIYGKAPLLQEGYWAGILEESLFPALGSTMYYLHLTMIRRRRT